MPTTHNLTTWSAAHPQNQTESPYKVNQVSNIIDCAVFNVDSGDTVQALTIPAKSHVISVAIEVLTAEGGTLTVDVGDGDTPNLYGNDLNCNALTKSAPALSTAKFYSADDTIDLLFNNAAAAARIRVSATLFDYS